MCNSVKKILNQQALSAGQQGPLTIGDRLPKFTKKAIVTTGNGLEIIEINEQYGQQLGKWTVLFWWPKDFTFVCPTEIIAFDENLHRFAEHHALVLGASTDTEYTHLAWRKMQSELAHLQLPMLAYTSKSLAEAMGILDSDEKVALRATYIIDPKGMIQWMSIYPMNVGRNVEEVLRVLEALQTEELTACGWLPGTPTLTSKLQN